MRGGAFYWGVLGEVIAMRMIELTLLLTSLSLLTPIIQARTTEDPTVSNPALQAELLNRVKQADIMLERLLKCTSEFWDCDAPIDRLKKTFDDNAVRLKALVKQYGWPGNDLVGRDGTWAAFLILLNAELAINKEMLPLVQDAYHAGRTDGTIYAILLDDIRVAEGKPQVYGTADKEGGGVYPIEDAANFNKRRAEVGLPPLSEYPEKQERNKAPQKNDKGRPRLTTH
jgi:hypothetical protein